MRLWAVVVVVSLGCGKAPRPVPEPVNRAYTPDTWGGGEGEPRCVWDDPRGAFLTDGSGCQAIGGGYSICPTPWGGLPTTPPFRRCKLNQAIGLTRCPSLDELAVEDGIGLEQRR